MAHPKVTVLMSVYNGEKYLKEAMESILNQSFSDFEFLIFNDCSTDSSREIIVSFNDPRIILTDNEKNIGLTKSLNKGISLAKGKYIARMDADDVSHPERLSEQVNYMEKNNDVAVCGSWVQFLNESEIVELPTEKNEIKVGLFCNSCLAHPSVMMRKSFLEKYALSYNEQLKYAQDYELWVKCSHYGTIENIPKPLLFYRRHDEQVSTHKKSQQEDSANAARLLQLQFLEIVPEENERQMHLSIIKSQFQVSHTSIHQSMNWIERLLNANKKAKAFPDFYFDRLMSTLRKNMLTNYYDRQNYDLNLLRSFFTSSFSPANYLSLAYTTRFFIKCLFHLKNKKIIF